MPGQEDDLWLGQGRLLLGQELPHVVAESDRAPGVLTTDREPSSPFTFQPVLSGIYLSVERSM